MPVFIGVGLSKILGRNNIGGQTKIVGEKVAITDESTGISQLLGAHAWAAPPKFTPMPVFPSVLI